MISSLGYTPRGGRPFPALSLNASLDDTIVSRDAPSGKSRDSAVVEF